MGWIRAGRRLGGWLALFALVLQLTLAFGHIHAEDFHKDAAPPTSHVADEAGGAPAAPAPDHDDCPICVTAHLTGAAALPAPLQFALPLPEPFAWRVTIEHRVVPHATRQPFQARAPPQA